MAQQFKPYPFCEEKIFNIAKKIDIVVIFWMCYSVVSIHLERVNGVSNMSKSNYEPHSEKNDINRLSSEYVTIFSTTILTHSCWNKYTKSDCLILIQIVTVN